VTKKSCYFSRRVKFALLSVVVDRISAIHCSLHSPSYASLLQRISKSYIILLSMTDTLLLQYIVSKCTPSTLIENLTISDNAPCFKVHQKISERQQILLSLHANTFLLQLATMWFGPCVRLLPVHVDQILALNSPLSCLTTISWCQHVENIPATVAQFKTITMSQVFNTRW
jgi:hypothetical protein